MYWSEGRARTKTPVFRSMWLYLRVYVNRMESVSSWSPRWRLSHLPEQPSREPFLAFFLVIYCCFDNVKDPAR